jgi:hypothetical protein
MNREITGGGGATIYPLVGDVTSVAGNTTVSVTGIQGIPVPPQFPTGGEVLTYDGPSNTLNLIAPATPATVTLETNGTLNSTQSLLNLQAGTNITMNESGGTVTINAPTPTGASTIITNFQPQSAVTGNGAAQNILAFNIAANTIPPGKGVEFSFACEGSTGVFGTQLWEVIINSTTYGWNGVSSTSGYAFAGFRIVNDNSSTTSNSLVFLPMIQNTVSGTVITAGPLATTSLTTTSVIPVTLTWNGPNTITTQVVQAYLKFI